MAVIYSNRWNGEPPREHEGAWGHLLFCLENGQTMSAIYETAPPRGGHAGRWLIRHRPDDSSPGDVSYRYAYIGPLGPDDKTLARGEELEQHFWALRVDPDEGRLATP